MKKLAQVGILYREKQRRRAMTQLPKRHMSRSNLQHMEVDAEECLSNNRPRSQLEGRHITKEDISHAFGALDGITYVPSQEGCVYIVLYCEIYTETVKRA